MSKRPHRSGTAAIFAVFSVIASGCTTVAPGVESPVDQNLVRASLDAHSQGVDFRDMTFCTRPGTKALASVIRVATDSGSEASGVVIAQDRVLTAAHVVDDSNTVLVYINERYEQASVIARDLTNDLALLSADTQQIEPIRISRRHLLSAEPVWTVGYPLALDLKTNSGRYQQHVNGAIHSSAGTNAGASGGGLLNCESGEYELAGMIRGYGAYWRDGELHRLEDLSISVPADTISAFANNAGVGL
ncbi:MAG: serine protease [Pseudomonadota bacterium]